MDVCFQRDVGCNNPAETSMKTERKNRLTYYHPNLLKREKQADKQNFLFYYYHNSKLVN